jgi:hypothetical protein
MHDPLTVAFEIKYPWRKWGNSGRTEWEKGYRESFITIWHLDPQTDGSDDSCDWFGSKRTRANGWYPATLDDYEALPKAARQAVDFVWRVWRHKIGRPWYQHPRWHIWHWQLQIHPWQKLRRWLFTRCAACGKRFAYGESPVTNQWHSPKPLFFCGEIGLFHEKCTRLRSRHPEKPVQPSGKPRAISPVLKPVAQAPDKPKPQLAH